MSSFLKETWEDISPEELSRAKGAFLAFTSGLEDGASKEQFMSITDPMLSLQHAITEMKALKIT